MEKSNNVAGVGLGAMREKYWSELTDSEKIERTRSQVKTLQWKVEDLENAMYILRKTFIEHSHLEGKVVKNVHEIESHFSPRGASLGRIGDGKGADEVYF